MFVVTECCKFCEQVYGKLNKEFLLKFTLIDLEKFIFLQKRSLNISFNTEELFIWLKATLSDWINTMSSFPARKFFCIKEKLKNRLLFFFSRFLFFLRPEFHTAFSESELQVRDLKIWIKHYG